jgi:hypothetical protein
MKYFHTTATTPKEAGAVAQPYRAILHTALSSPLSYNGSGQSTIRQSLEHLLNSNIVKASDRNQMNKPAKCIHISKLKPMIYNVNSKSKLNMYQSKDSVGKGNKCSKHTLYQNFFSLECTSKAKTDSVDCMKNCLSKLKKRMMRVIELKKNRLKVLQKVINCTWSSIVEAEKRLYNYQHSKLNA